MLDLVKYLFNFSGLILLMFLSGIFFLFLKRFRKIGVYFLIVGISIYLIFGFKPLSFWVVGQLEDKYPTFDNIDKKAEINYIVVLTGGGKVNKRKPISSQLNSSSAFRLIEAIRLLNKIQDAKILISGRTEVTELISKLMVELGIPKDIILLEQKSDNTYESAVNLKDYLATNYFYLVTSARHTPRAVGVFRKLGMNPIPAPTDYIYSNDFNLLSFFPSAQNLRVSDLASYEYLGNIWYKFRKQL